MNLIMVGLYEQCRGEGKKTCLVFTSLISLLSLWDINTHECVYEHVTCAESLEKERESHTKTIWPLLA